MLNQHYVAMVTPQVIVTRTIRTLQSQNRGRSTHYRSIVFVVVVVVVDDDDVVFSCFLIS